MRQSTCSSRRALVLTVLLVVLLALAAVGTASGTPDPSLRVVVRGPSVGAASASARAAAARAVSASPFAADITYRTEMPTTGRVGYGLAGGQIALWSEKSGPVEEHQAHLGGLRPGTIYRLVVEVAAADGRRGTTELQLTTPPYPHSGQAGIGGTAIVLNGEPFFPILAFGQCDNFGASVARGVNLFLLGGCSHENQKAEAEELAGRALVATGARSRLDGVPGQIGFVYDDETDEHGGTYETLPALAPWEQSGKLSFLTLTNHFYSGAEPLPQGRGMYPGLARRADILGFDLYPLQVWCRRSGFQHVYLAQRELDKLAGGRPTFQWVETAPMQCEGSSLAPTSKTVEAETWLAIAGGADGIGWFPWNPSSKPVAQMMKRLDDEIAALQPALLSPELPASAGGGVYATARTLNGAVYVIAVNSTRHTVTTPIVVPGLGRGTVQALFEPTRSVTSNADRFTDTFKALQTHVYVYVPELVAS